LPLGAAVVSAWLAQASADVETKVGHTELSADGKRAIRFRQIGKGQCQLEALRGNTPDFVLNQCLGTIDDLYFISNDGSRFWVLFTLPPKPKAAQHRPPQEVDAPPIDDLQNTVVAILFDRRGNAIRSKRLSDIAVTKKDRAHVRQLQTHFEWLEGVAGVPGRRPRLNPKNQVELEMIGGKTYTLAF
jgi:hypothetical protein